MKKETFRIVSWNVNGIRAAAKKGFLDWFKKDGADVVCLQEIKAHEEQVPEELRKPLGYHSVWNPALRKGYSGVATLSKDPPASIAKGFGLKHFDEEGRILITNHGDIKILNIYFPNGQSREERLKYKMSFYDAAMDYCSTLAKKGEKLVVCGDYNTAHTEIDIARPKENETTSGFLPMERAWMDKWVEAGFVDTFRLIKGGVKNEYSWWSQRAASRERNVGWRIDYHFVTKNLASSVKDAGIHQAVMGSDHCPVSLELKL